MKRQLIFPNHFHLENVNRQIHQFQKNGNSVSLLSYWNRIKNDGDGTTISLKMAMLLSKGNM